MVRRIVGLLAVTAALLPVAQAQADASRPRTPWLSLTGNPFTTPCDIIPPKERVVGEAMVSQAGRRLVVRLRRLSLPRARSAYRVTLARFSDSPALTCDGPVVGRVNWWNRRFRATVGLRVYGVSTLFGNTWKVLVSAPGIDPLRDNGSFVTEAVTPQ